MLFSDGWNLQSAILFYQFLLLMLLWWSYMKSVLIYYCGWLNFRGVPIFVVFVEGPSHEFQNPRISDFLYELWRKILWPRILNPTNVSFSFNPRKLVPTKIKPSTVLEMQEHNCIYGPGQNVYFIFVLLCCRNNIFVSFKLRIASVLCFRLSKFATQQLTQGNPNIADLSDRNRPTNIGDKFGQLYDDEWSEAYNALKPYVKSDEEILKILANLIQVCWKLVLISTSTSLASRSIVPSQWNLYIVVHFCSMPNASTCTCIYLAW